MGTLIKGLNGKLAARYQDSTKVWRETPVDFETFVISSEHMGLPSLFPRQSNAVRQLLGDDPLAIFEHRRFQLAVLLWGKGAGKDYLCSLLVAYLVYVLLCLEDPQRYFRFGAGEPIDVINVAYNADQARRVFFEKLRQRLLRWRWLHDHHNIFEAGRKRNSHEPGRAEVQINDGEVLFPRGIRCFSRHSENESYEGFNIVAWLMDEASAFLSKAKRENADRIYQTLRTSAASRFGTRWVGAIISYPRHGDDFTVTKLKEARANPELGIYADGPASTWEINERVGGSEMVEVRPGHKVPVELYNDYLLDFEQAIARYECQPPHARDAFFRFADRLDGAVAPGRDPLIEWEPIVTHRRATAPDGSERVREFIGVKLTHLGRIAKGTRLYFHGDPGLVNDSFALCLAHGEPATIMTRIPAEEVYDQAELQRLGLEIGRLIEWERDVTRAVIDAVIVWRPDPRNDRQVDLQNVEDVLMELRGAYGIGHRAKEPTGTFDHWNSAHIIQRLLSKHLNVADEAWSRGFQVDIYRNARTCFYNDLVTLPDTPSVTSLDPQQPGALYELKRIEFIDGSKIDHPEGGSKDIADAVVRAIQHVTGATQKRFAFGSAFGREESYRPKTYVSSSTPKVDPRRTPGFDRSMHEAEEERERTRPLGELSPSGGLTYTSVSGRRPN